ncbi:MAG: hypothetical protein NVSMB57_09630 [Actinomycetota bacterium]
MGKLHKQLRAIIALMALAFFVSTGNANALPPPGHLDAGCTGGGVKYSPPASVVYSVPTCSVNWQ